MIALDATIASFAPLPAPAPIAAYPAAPLSSLDASALYHVTIDGTRWMLDTFADGAVDVSDTDGCGALLPAHVASDIATVADAVTAALAARDRYRVIAIVAHVLLHGIVLSAPAQHPAGSVRHATCGRHPDGGDGYACITDPGGVVVSVRQVTRAGGTYVDDRTAYAAAVAWCDHVGYAGALWAIAKAREAAGE